MKTVLGLLIVVCCSPQIHALDQTIAEQEFQLAVAKAKAEMDTKTKPIQAEYDGKVKVARAKLISSLEAEKLEVMKKGDLEKAVSIKAKIEELKAESPDSAGNADPVAKPPNPAKAADPDQVLRDKAAPSIVGKWDVKINRDFSAVWDFTADGAVFSTNGSPQGKWTVTPTGIRIVWNEQCWDIFNYPLNADGLKGDSWKGKGVLSAKKSK